MSANRIMKRRSQKKFLESFKMAQSMSKRAVVKEMNNVKEKFSLSKFEKFMAE